MLVLHGGGLFRWIAAGSSHLPERPSQRASQRQVQGCHPRPQTHGCEAPDGVGAAARLVLKVVQPAHSAPGSRQQTRCKRSQQASLACLHDSFQSSCPPTYRYGSPGCHSTSRWL